jgi:hypothetical protein
MSKTDKTRPYWVKLRDPFEKAKYEIHDHRDGICNFEEQSDNIWPRKCGYTVNYYRWNSGFFSRGPARWLKAEIRISNGSARARLRKDIDEMLKLSREDIIDYDSINPCHRHSAVWYS